MTTPTPCDLVMKGGVTSGIVYPHLVTRLARRHRFVRIGGASAGAIAAAFTAAAEFDRHERAGGHVPAGDGPTGFELLHTMPDTLAHGLPGLFAPRHDLRHHLAAVLALVDRRGVGGKVGPALRHAVAGTSGRLGPGLVLCLAAGVGLGLAVWAWGGAAPWAALVAGTLLAVLLAGIVALASLWWFVRVGVERMVDNGYGLVRGLTDPAEGTEPGGALTEWLTDTLDAVAGLPAGRVLTFGDLWGPEAVEQHRRLRLGSAERVVDPVELEAFSPRVDLQVMTTCLSLRRPYTFPFTTRIFHWCPTCWAGWFPPRVVAALEEASKPAHPQRQRIDGEPTPIPDHCPHHPGTRLRQLPHPSDVPVVVGVRLSLSFPGVVSAVPMWVLDRYRAEGNWAYREVWFSDGGLTSNFPLEFFDAPLPGHPTFGVTLEAPHPDFPDTVAFRPVTNNSGILGRVRPITGAGQFVEAILGVLVDWRDALTVPAAGNRDRVVEVRIPEDAGGLHLTMPPEVVADVARRGEEGAALLESFDWDNHRWIRYRTATAGLGDLLHDVRENWPHYTDLVARDVPPSYPVADGRADDDRAATASLLEAAGRLRDLDNPAHSGSVPTPRRAFRATPST
ncbi:patatin-like phospholipase family protein [Propioniciclava sp. MC1595]|uniref:patatin-like phospholipase family protein n=1 Tax=unclassified Propioniciclava TaxID=2642922 RepID=UPI001602B0BD|nr:MULTISPECIES: patatin-like phospholipase family protein [unclassified Propioniciclava]MBB1494736.1 patatin-like phospholipase family protein [Propioniciclava sp. MC1595]MBB1502476.1 patatin-like phospholipase family protein [Propioniciclava sp. MC1683]QTE25810.1 patatin-like phospholipase family protein [Propioniciclava sp. MC1595]